MDPLMHNSVNKLMCIYYTDGWLGNSQTNFVVQLTAIVVLEPAHHMLASFVEVRIVGLKSLTNPGV